MTKPPITGEAEAGDLQTVRGGPAATRRRKVLILSTFGVDPEDNRKRTTRFPRGGLI